MSKNIQIIDGARNTAYDIYSCDDGDFATLFVPGTNIEFIDDVMERLGEAEANAIFSKLWTRPVIKSQVHGIHGTLFYQLEHKKPFYPNKRESDLDGKGRPWRHANIDQGR